MEVQFRASTCVENFDHSMAGEGLCACRKTCRGKWAKKLVRTRLDDYPSLKGGGLVGETEEVAPWFYRCRYCGRWKDSGAFSSGQVQWASESDFSRGPRRVRREPVCRGCAGFALHLERGVSETEVAGSLPLESRFALIMTFSGEYPGLPEFNEDILRCIFSFLMVRVAPRLSYQPLQPSTYFCPARSSSDRCKTSA